MYLGLTPLDDARSGLADYWNTWDDEALPAPFDAADFDAPEVKTAYLNFCRRAVAHYQPDYLAIGLEVNLLASADPARWPALAALLGDTYEALRADYPELPIFVTATAVDLLEGFTDVDPAAQRMALTDLLTFSDYLALSFYPFMSRYLVNPIPDDTFDRLAVFAAGKPIVIAETGFPAQTTALSTFSLEGTPEKQDAWINLVLAEAHARRMPFVVNFVIRDYDALWFAAGASDELAIWRDTGLFVEDGAERPALRTWRRALGR